MVYKKYLKKGGKSFGPYYYESFRQGNEVKKRYIGGEKEYQIWLNKNKKDVKKVEQLVIIPKKTFNLGILLFFLSLITLVFIIGINLGYFFNVSPLIMTGFAVSENNSFEESSALLYGSYEEEVVVKQFDTEKVDLQIKEPPKFSGEALTKNKNKRMDFNLSEGKLILYFDLLNYSEFVENIAGVFETGKVVKETEVGMYKKEIPEETKGETNVTPAATENVTAPENVTSRENVSEVPIEEVNVSLPKETKTETKNATEKTPIVVEEPQSPAESKPTEPAVEQQVPETGVTGSIIKSITGFVINIGKLTASVIGLDNESINESIGPITEPATETAISQKDNINLNTIQEKVSSFSENELETIADSSVIKAEDFNIEIDESKLQEKKPEYKWGYKVKLNSLNFMAKIDVTSDNNISVWNDDTLKIGNQLLSFADLVKAGYVVRIEKPALEINISIETTNQANEISQTETTTTEENISNVNETGNEAPANETPVSEPATTNETPAEIPAEQTPPPKTPAEQTPTETPSGITGNIIKRLAGSLGITGKAIEETEIEDLKYKNTVTVYIERDFTNNSEGINVGDIIDLDPTLIIIEISKAEHLDENRNFLSDIYPQVQTKDNNWSEAISNNEYVRVTFEQSLTNKNDITFYGRSADNCSTNLSGSIIINGESVPCDIYNKKKRIDEIRRLLEE